MVLRKCSGVECHEAAQDPEGLNDEIRGGAGTVEEGVELDGEDGYVRGRVSDFQGVAELLKLFREGVFGVEAVLAGVPVALDVVE